LEQHDGEPPRHTPPAATQSQTPPLQKVEQHCAPTVQRVERLRQKQKPLSQSVEQHCSPVAQPIPLARHRVVVVVALGRVVLVSVVVVVVATGAHRQRSVQR
jgi:hypothetical protein